MTTLLSPAASSQRQSFEVSFASVPKCTLEDLDVTLALIALKRKDSRAASFGGYVVRQVGMGVAEHVMRYFDMESGALSPEDFVIGDDDPLHIDDSSEGLEQNDITAHVTISGVAEAIILVGTTIRNGAMASDFVTERLFDNLPILAMDDGIFPVTEPVIAFRTKLRAGDVLVFDHTQAHAFRSLSEDRQSVALFTE